VKTPISYYGGKRQLATIILGLIPEHRIYCEPFMGGAAVFFAKEPSEVEIINDTNGELINFYEVVQRDFPALEQEIAVSLHSRRQHRQAQAVYNNPDLFDKVKRAWAVWVLANNSYGSKPDGSYGYDRTGKNAHKPANKRASFTAGIAERLQHVQIECYDALRVIGSRDMPAAFFYCDPPYVGANQGHYDGYTQENFNALPGVLETIKGKFLLSSYRNATLRELIERHGWTSIELRMASAMTNMNSKQKIEVLTANYPIAVEAKKLGKKQEITEKE
jgi:DNA adenine methylase